MQITTENAITGAVAKALREQVEMQQGDFWRSVASTPSSGTRYEQGEVIPLAIRRLIFLTYVAHLPATAATEEDAALAIHAGHVFHLDLAGGRPAVAKIIAETAAQLRKAAAAIGI